MPGTLLAHRYRIVRQLGRGGMGVVYQADDQRLRQLVALKFLPASLAQDARGFEQFHNEVRLARQITHPNVCRVYDIADVEGHLFLSMEYVEGGDLAGVLRSRGALPEAEAVELARQICAGLAAVHASGVLHRDLKPANIMINHAGMAQLMDFGIAMSGDGEHAERITEGTPAYMAPEQLVEGRVSVQSDIYALGLVMYELFTGRRLLAATTLDELRQQHAGVASRLVGDLSTITPELREAVVRCLDRDPTRRPAAAQDVAGMLQLVLLDVETRWRRVRQVLTQFAFVPAVVLGAALLFRGGGEAVAGTVIAGAFVVLLFIELRNPLGWTTTYKGHNISFRNHLLVGERLYLDGALVDRGRFGDLVTLRATIERGAGAGERITATVRATVALIACRIVVDAFMPAFPGVAAEAVPQPQD